MLNFVSNPVDTGYQLKIIFSIFNILIEYSSNIKNDVNIFVYFQNEKPFSVDEISRELRLFGPIESIQIIKKLETNVEVYVLYDRCQNAFDVFHANRNGILHIPNLLQIVPADTWHQPDSHTLWNTINPEKCSILHLNDDCLLHIFTFLDFDTLVKLAFVCTRFKNVLDEFYFPKRKTLSIHVFHSSLNAIRLAMKCIGPYVERLCLRYNKHGVNAINYLQSEHEERATYKILQYCGKKLKKLSIHKPEGRKLSDKLYNLLAPTMTNLTYLEWYTEFDCSTIETFHELCPHLETLILKKRTFSCNCAHNAANLHWPTLISLETFQQMFALNIPCQRHFERLVYSNPQLKRLKFTNMNVALFNVVTEHSKSLEYLEILQNSGNFDFFNHIHLLRNLQQLKVFVLRVKWTVFLANVESQIKSLSQVKQLELVVLLRNYTWPVWPFENFPYIHHNSKIIIDDKKLTLKIGENVACINYSKGETTLVNVINANNPNESSNKGLLKDIHLTLESSKRYFAQCDEVITFKNAHCYQFIQTCRKSL